MNFPAPKPKAIAKGAGSKEVSGEADGATLSQCLADGRVPVPDRMTFPKWQQWRKAEGRRPIKRKDGVGLSTAEEVALWRATMEELYGEDVEQLLKELFEIYDPVKENLSEYLDRVTRLALALKTLGHNVSAVDLERITIKAEMLKEAFDLVGSEPKALVRSLREKFARLALDEGLGEQERSMQVGRRGGYTHAVQNKTVEPRGGSDSPVRAKLAALEMEVEALRRGSEASSPEKDMVLALEAQTKVLQEALSSRGVHGRAVVYTRAGSSYMEINALSLFTTWLHGGYVI
eukprot:symbB.v1.2.014263.t1/scaffold1033.1/size247163/1